MNREEAAGVLSAMRNTLKKVYLVAIDEERISALESAIGFLLAEDNNVPVKQPDPITGLATDTNVARKDPVTGLVPCGCGGKAIMLCDLEYAVACEKCLINLPYAFDTKELARQAWNTAMGDTAPPLPGAIGPETGGMAPNGDKGAES